jgi:hypothetical protein
MTQALITAGIAVAGIVVGWFVIGTQRVTEELTTERRKAYGEVVAKADSIASGSARSSEEFVRAVWAADFVCSDRMYKASRLSNLLVDIGTTSWMAEVDRFYELARFESHRNSMLRRWSRRGWYDGDLLDMREPSRLAERDLRLHTEREIEAADGT